MRPHGITHPLTSISDGGDGGDGGDGDAAAGDGRCRAPRQHVGQRAVPGGASDQHEPIKNLMKKMKEQV